MPDLDPRECKHEWGEPERWNAPEPRYEPEVHIVRQCKHCKKWERIK